MKLLKYTNFLGFEKVDENIQQSKKFLKDRYIQYKIYSDPKFQADLSYEQKEDLKKGVGNIKLTDFKPDHQEEIRIRFRETKVSEDELRRIERHPDFMKIKEMLGDRNFGYAYMFVYFHFVEKLPLDECKTLFDRMQKCSDLLGRLRRPIANFIDPNLPNNYENLADDLVKIDHYRAYKKFINELTTDLKKQEPDAPVAVKRKLEELALAFDDIGKDPHTGKVDEEVRRSLQKIFFEKIKRWKTLRELINATENYLKGVTNTGMANFYQMIEKCIDKFGQYGGCEIVYDEANILVLEIKSYAANRFLNSSTSHCIKDSQSSWDSYVGGETNYNKQYYIYNFNLVPSDNNSIIGITIEPGQGIRACHDKRDGSLGSGIKSLLNRWESQLDLKSGTIWSHLQPMTKEEQKIKQRRVIANREIIKPGLTLAQVRDYITKDAADPNAGFGQALHNAVVENNYEKTKLLLELGALPNVRFQNKGRMEATIGQAADLDMIKLLVSFNSELTQEVFKKINDDYDAIKYCLEQGLDPNFDNGLALRLACRSGNIETIKLVIEYGAHWKDQKNMPLCWAAEHTKKNVIEWLCQNGLTDGWERAMNWLQHSRKLQTPAKLEMLDYLQTFIDAGRVTLSDEAVELQKRGGFKYYKDFVKSRIRPEKGKK